MIHHIPQRQPVINNTVNTINQELARDAKEQLNITKEGNYVKRPIKAKQAEYYYDNNEAIANVVEIRREDTIQTNYIHIKSDIELSPNDLLFYEKLLNSNKTDLAYIISDNTLYGAGAGEILLIDESTVRINHIPQTQLEIILIKDSDGLEYPLVEVKDYNNKVVSYNRIFHYYYSENFPTTYKKLEIGYMFWYGGGMFNDFYDKPFYLQLQQDILSQISVKEGDTKTFNTGNQTSGIVYINKSGVQSINTNPIIDTEAILDLQPIEDDLETLTSNILPANVETLKSEISKAGFGNAFFYEETDDPMQMNYINLTNNNQDYVLKKLEGYKNEVYRRAKIPKERLMDSSVKESMNSQKTVAIWTIYLNSVNSNQQRIEQLLCDYLFFIYDSDLIVSVDVPEFEEFKIARANLAMDLFNNAGITHENYITRLNSIYEWVSPDNLNNWYSRDYFYNGKLLSDLTESSNENVMGDLEQVIGDTIECRTNR